MGTGGNAAQDCENKIVMRDCKEKEVCAIGSGNNYIWRGCISRSRFDGMQPKCQKIKENCVMAMCDTANCRPELPQENNYCVKGKNDYDVLKQLQNASEVFLLDFYI